jgi:hypothetical protein
MLGRNLLFATREEAVDRRLFTLAAISDASHTSEARGTQISSPSGENR